MRHAMKLMIAIAMLCSSAALADISPQAANKLYKEVTPSLVGVQYTWKNELGQHDLVGAGVVVSDDGVVITSLAVFDMRIPDKQMQDFKIIVPQENADPREIDAELLGRDERSNLAFLKATGKDAPDWKPIHFEDLPPKIGDTVIAVGLLPKAAGYRSYLSEGVVASKLRGETPLVMVGGGQLTVVGSPVFNTDGKAIGFINAQTGQQIWLMDNPHVLASITNPPSFFVPARDFLPSLKDPPVAGQPMQLPWIGVTQLTGLKKDVAEFFGLKGKPAVEIGDVLPGGPADKAGLKRGMKIIEMNGKPLERGDDPDEIPAILARQIRWMKVGDKVTFAVMTEAAKPLQKITVTLGPRPMQANAAERSYDDRLGFSVREMVPLDAYARKLPADQKGVVVTLIKPQSAANAAQLKPNDLITQLNGQLVTSLDQFKKNLEQLEKEKPEEAVVLVVERDGREETLRIQPPR